MATLTPKQMEIRQRERRILDTAYPMLRDGGVTAINMGDIAKAMNYTRGTIYNHFPHKEDILVSLATRAIRRRHRLFEHALGLEPQTRDTIAAVGLAAEVYVDRLPDDFMVEQIIRHQGVWQKTSEARRKVLVECENGCIGLLSGVIERALREGDLNASGSQSAKQISEEIVFGLWSLVYGGLVIQSTSPSLEQHGIGDPRGAIRRNCNRLLDRFGWQPLHDARRYAALVRRCIPKLSGLADTLADEDIEP